MKPYNRASALPVQALLFLRGSVSDALHVCTALFKIMIPAVIIVKLLQEAGMVVLLGDVMSPVMRLFDLPGSMALVWATAMLTNLYAAAAVLISMLPGTPLTVAQVTVLATMMLIAHALPVELGIARRSGARLRTQLILRVGGALLCGWLLALVYALLNMGTAPVHPAWIPEGVPEGWIPWMISETRNLAVMAFIILVLIMLLNTLKATGVTDLLVRALAPLFNILGVGREAGTITIIGMTLGLSYGGGLIINEARSGGIPARDIFFALSFMGLTHSLVEDTMLMFLLGADLLGILWARVLFTIVVIWLLTKFVSAVPDRFIRAALVRPPAVM
ncbi:MAG: hypothetical protein AVO39_02765 [delta proteobacterium MLS_D]|jgi:spore maturation protein SpmB|nr:MAG: hypothetical protein AVO39_02765 [delta proteobacterium MLS_D]